MSALSLQRAEFLLSVGDLRQLPPDHGAEVAFAGRSNAGKSSAINAITGVAQLARTSKTPGRTQLLNFFSLGSPERRLLDLPGYGFARVPVPVKERWERNIAEYLRRRESLRGLVLVADSRHPLSPPDRSLCQWCHERGLPVRILLTKADKLGFQAQQLALRDTHATVAALGNVEVQLFSAVSALGREQARGLLAAWLADSQPEKK